MKENGFSELFMTFAKLCAAALMGLAVSVTAFAETKLLRYPDIHKDFVVFTYAGDLWRAPGAGGAAFRLTAHPGLELFAKISPDGNSIAFTGQYDGDEQVYVIPATGGEPKKLTHYPARGPLPPRWGYDNQVYGWTPDGKSVLYRSLMDGFDLTDSRLYTVAVAGGEPKVLPMPVSGAGAFSPDGSRLLYSPLFRDFRTWKRYQGGWAQDLYIFDLAGKRDRNVTSTVRTERDPMWLASGLYYASDRSGILNLYHADSDGANVSAMTAYTSGDVKWASDGPAANGASQIVFERNGTLHVLNTATNAIADIAITVADDRVHARPKTVSVAENLEDADVGKDGSRVVIAARGDIFSVPVKDGSTRNLTATSSAHDRLANVSPDGKTVAFVSDGSGEEEVWLVAENGRSAPRQLSHGNSRRITSLRWSPVGKHLLMAQKTGALFLVDAATGTQREIDRSAAGPIGDATFSPDGAYVAYSKNNENYIASIYIYSVDGGSARRVTDPLFEAREPVWDRGGKYLYYLSDREFAPILSNREQNYAVAQNTGIFVMALARGTGNPIPVGSDKGVLDKADAKPDDNTKGKKSNTKASAAKSSSVIIDFEGLAQRTQRLPQSPGGYVNLNAIEGGIAYMVSNPDYFGRQANPKALEKFDIESKRTSRVGRNVQSYGVSADGKYFALFGAGGELSVAKTDGDDDGTDVDVAKVQTMIDPQAEWRTAFNEVWRRYRDYFYVENMHGYDWKSLGDRYRTLLPSVSDRSDLNYVMGEMVAELNIGHAYVSGGDSGSARRPEIGLLGARYALDAATGKWKIMRIFPGQNEEYKYRAPLTELGVNAKAGDYLLAIDGRPLSATLSPDDALTGKREKIVELLIGTTSNAADARTVLVKTLGSETSLLYLDYVLANKARVDRLSGGRLGYLHIPDMGEDGLYEFIKWYYPQVRKQGLVIDVRTNGGGFVSQMIVERLKRTLLAVDETRDVSLATTYPSTVFTGPMVAIADEDTASDGDIFTAMFKRAKLGPVVGKRTWGGVVGISEHGPLIDGGSVFVPESATADTDGNYIIEGHGVDPDIVVEQESAKVIAGEDPQLERAVAEALARLKDRPSALPGRPADPVKLQ
jgi:tricorn protease